MSEKEKMLAGLIYDANNDDNLLKERNIAKDLCFEFNNTKSSDALTQEEILNKLNIKKGENVTVIAPFYCDYGYNIEIGNNFFSNHNLIILDASKVKFGNDVFIACNCGFYTSGHPVDYKERNKGLEYAYPITVGDNVWIGSNVSVLPGVNIGSNVVIGAGSVVNKDIPDNVIAVGNPCKVIKEIK